jgi:hypothetical protein
LFTWRHNEEPNSACKNSQNNILSALYNCSCVASKVIRHNFTLITKLNKRVSFYVFRETWYIFSLNMIKTTYFHSPYRLVKIWGILSCFVKIYSIFHSNEKYPLITSLLVLHWIITEISLFYVLVVSYKIILRII